jgi:hypothetical protein
MVRVAMTKNLRLTGVSGLCWWFVLAFWRRGAKWGSDWRSTLRESIARSSRR